MSIPEGLLLLANYGNWLTASRLEYKEPHAQGIDRFQAAALLLHTGKVHRTHEKGYYMVESQEQDSKVMYQVVVVEGDCSCTCTDSTISRFNPLGLCVHQLASAMDMTIQNTLGTRYSVTEPILLVKLLCDAGINVTHGQGRRMISQGCVRLDGQIVRNTALIIYPPSEPMVLEVGKHEKLELIGVTHE